jgi:hypothetical protein
LPAACSFAPQQQWQKLLELIETKLTGRRDRELHDAVRNFSGPPHQLRNDSSIKRMLQL